MFINTHQYVWPNAMRGSYFENLCDDIFATDAHTDNIFATDAHTDNAF